MEGSQGSCLHMELVLIGVGLSMDAFAVALCKGLGMRRINYAHAAVIALFFGVFQAVMPLIGWVLGTQFARYITSVDHWIAFALLGYIGGKMIWDALHEAPEAEPCADESRLNPIDEEQNNFCLFFFLLA